MPSSIPSSQPTSEVLSQNPVRSQASVVHSDALFSTQSEILDMNDILTTASRPGLSITTPSRVRTFSHAPGAAPTSPIMMRSSSPQLVQASSTTGVSEQEAPAYRTEYIWGTTIVIGEVVRTFERFLRKFTKARHLPPELATGFAGQGLEDHEPFYPQLFKKLKDSNTTHYNLDCRYLMHFNDGAINGAKLYRQLVNYPAEVIAFMDHVASRCWVEWFPETETLAPQVMTHPFNLAQIADMRALNPSDMDKLVTIKGIVIRTSQIIPELKIAYFRCSLCEFSCFVTVERERLNEPTDCGNPNCEARNTMEVIHNRSRYTDKQIAKLQETPDVIPDGQTPHSVVLCLYDDLVDVAKPGDRVNVTGVFRGVPVRVNPYKRTVRTVFRTFLDVVHVQKMNVGRLESELLSESAGSYDESDQLKPFSAQEEAWIKQLATRSDLYDLLARSVAPSIYEHEDVKKGILLQLFGASSKQNSNEGPRLRGDIHVLLVGDPSTSKSQILQYAHRISPRGSFTSGKGSSAVGLTAYVTRDAETKQLVLESGALVLSDGGLCCIDEFDKMTDSTRSILHEVMEQQTVSIAKAGVITTLNARTSILASANPIGSRWNDKLPILQNIALPPTLLSRFDLVYILLDKVDERHDRRLAQHLLSLYLDDRPEEEIEVLSIEQLTRYISYSRKKIKPVLRDEAASKSLVEAYVSLRRIGRPQHRVTATTRQLESMIRLAEAHARMRLSERVEEQDVTEAVRLLKEAIKESATDPRTGLIDMDLLTTGIGMSARHQLDMMKREIQLLLGQRRSVMVAWSVLLRELNEQSQMTVNSKEFEQALQEMETEQLLRIISKPQKERMIQRLFSGSAPGAAAVGEEGEGEE